MMKKILIIISVLLSIAFLNVNTFAMQQYAGKTGNITVNLVDAVDGVKFELYKIADLDNEETKFIISEVYADLDVNINYTKEDTVDWDSIIVKIRNYIIVENIASDYSKETVQGKIVFEDIPVGLYLLSGPKSVLAVDGETYIYTPQSALISIPAYTSDGKFTYDSEVVNKYDKEYVPYDDEQSLFTRLTVIKKFDDSGYENKRPSEIKANLFQDNTLFDSAILNADNNFQHAWVSLSKEYTWTVIEEKVEGYVESYTSPDKYTVVITNTYTPPTPPSTLDEPKLPSTGVLWWPVPVLLLTGAACLILSYNDKKQND